MVLEEDENADKDVFAQAEDNEEKDGQELSAPDAFEELPIEIRSLTERYWSWLDNDVTSN